MTNKRLAIVIGSGGAKCAAALGMWKILQSADVIVAGTFDAHLIPYVIEQGSKATQEPLPYLQRLLAEE